MKRLNFRKNKRGAVTDIIMWIVVGIVAIIFMALLYYAFAVKAVPNIKNAFNNTMFQNLNGNNITNASVQIFDNVTNGMTDNFGWITFGVLIAMAINILLGCFLVRVHPATAITIYTLIGIAAFMISVPVSNGYENLMSSGSEFTDLLSTEFSGASFIMLNLPIWVSVIFFIGLILLCAGIPRDKGAGGGPTA